MKKCGKDETGTILIAFALLLLLLLGFAALGTEAGRWFLVRAELSKSVDAGALAGAKNISNPHVDPQILAAEFCAENFPSGYLGTPAAGSGSATFDVQLIGHDRIQVDGHASAMAILAKVVGVGAVPVASSGVAQQNKVEIMLVLDRSGSMAGKPIADLKKAARSFLDFFTETQDRDKAGLVSYATSARVDRPLGTDYVAPMKAAIDAMAGNGHTNAEDAIAQAGGPQGFTDQTGVPDDQRIQQFLIFFSDGRPNSFRWTFKNRGTTYDAVVFVDGNCDPGDRNTTNQSLWRPDREQQLGIAARPTGDGVYPGSKCGVSTTRWNIFDTRPVPGYAADACKLPDPALGNHVCGLAASLALEHAQELKDRRITIYTIGLGTTHRQFLEQLASNPGLYYYAPASDQLQRIFQKVAQEIKLRLVQ